MTTLKFRPLLRTAAAAAIILVGSVPALPVWAGSGDPLAAHTPAPEPGGDLPAPEPAGASPVDMSTASGAPAPVISDAGLAEAVRRDLGLTLEEFNAAGAVARRAADAAPTLRELPGYLGISLSGGRIAVDGEGQALQDRIDELNQEGPADFFLRAPHRTAAAEPAADAPATDAPSADAPAAAATAAEAAPLVASSVEQLFQAYVREVGSAGLQAVAYAGGHFIIRAGGSTVIETGLPEADPADPARPLPAGAGPQPAAPAPEQRLTPEDFVARYANVALEEGSPIATEDDFFGGQGYIIDGRTVCSAGFGAYNAAGEPVLLTAGHCSEDGAATKAEVELATAAPAGTPPGGTPGSGTAAGSLGSFGFSQFGGPGNTTAAANGGAAGTDIAVLESISSDVRLQPAVTRWDDPNTPGPTAVKIIGTVTPFQGQPVCRSGRTLGWSCGTVDSVGIFTVGGRNNFPDGADLRALHGFDSTTVKSRPGDSGGPWISGNFAVGTHTGAETEGSEQLRAVAATLTDAVDRIPGGIELQVFLNKPELDVPAGGSVAAGAAMSGRVPAAPASAVPAQSRVRISLQGQDPFEVPVDAAGGFSFAVPAASGARQVAAETVNGFSRSGETLATLNITAQAAPVGTEPGPAGPGSGPAVAGPGAAARAAEDPAGAAGPAAPGAAGPGSAGSVAVQPAEAGQAAAESAAVPSPTARPTAPAPASSPTSTAAPEPAASGRPEGARADATRAGLPGIAVLAVVAGGAALLGVVLLVLSRRRLQR